jgi:hypothetical protein
MLKLPFAMLLALLSVNAGMAQIRKDYFQVTGRRIVAFQKKGNVLEVNLNADYLEILGRDSVNYFMEEMTFNKDSLSKGKVLFNLPKGHKLYYLPFDGKEPVFITREGGGGGGISCVCRNKCGDGYCPVASTGYCHPNCSCGPCRSSAYGGPYTDTNALNTPYFRTGSRGLFFTSDVEIIFKLKKM